MTLRVTGMVWQPITLSEGFLDTGDSAIGLLRPVLYFGETTLPGIVKVAFLQYRS